MLKATENFIKENLELIRENKWDEIYEHSIETSELLVYIDFLKTMLKAGINPNLDKYTLNDLEVDLSVISGMHVEDFTEPKRDGQHICLYLNNKGIAEALTRLLIQTRRIDSNDLIKGDPRQYNNVKICIPEIYDINSYFDKQHNLQNAILEIHVQTLHNELEEIYYEEGPFEFNDVSDNEYDLKDFDIRLDSQYEDNINKFLDHWVEVFFTED